MSKRKSFNITDLNNEEIKNLQQAVKNNGSTVQQAEIINLAIELFFRNKDDDYSNIIKQMKIEHLI